MRLGGRKIFVFSGWLSPRGDLCQSVTFVGESARLCQDHKTWRSGEFSGKFNGDEQIFEKQKILRDFFECKFLWDFACTYSFWNFDEFSSTFIVHLVVDTPPDSKNRSARSAERVIIPGKCYSVTLAATVPTCSVSNQNWKKFPLMIGSVTLVLTRERTRGTPVWWVFIEISSKFHQNFHCSS